jgi:hypothetical protein
MSYLYKRLAHNLSESSICKGLVVEGLQEPGQRGEDLGAERAVVGG